MGSFEDRVAIITGGAAGIGGATARVLASRGTKVLIADIDEETAAVNVQRIADAGGTAAAIRTDVSKAEDSQRMVGEALDRWGRLDILVQNAFGVVTMPEGFQGGAEDVEEEAWEYGISVLAKALYLGAKYAVPVMREGGGRQHRQPRLGPQPFAGPRLADIRSGEICCGRHDTADGDRVWA